ncbi:hypothetical protein DFR70_1021034 [Nocardia tenerifensis]|uniref:Uncharacterized protein n=1 Tax=Nocardia tenerifensis TaxID=228006 RepID=A0A318K8A6_9NOCA|nr:hypothetical protein [Nocardia tenerifensis]PXX69345.1 hypothetical protein DFR70_1021034 [Nocardia tenerifensis]
MAAHSRISPKPSHEQAPPRTARNMVCGFAILAVLAAVLPPAFPATLPAARGLMWWLLAALGGGLAAVLTARPATPRSLVLGAGWLLVVGTVLQAFLIGDLIAMFATWLVVPILALLAGQLRPKPRKALVASHAVASACWVGTGLTVSAMSVVAMTTADLQTARVVYELMEVIDRTLLPWTNFATFLTGVGLGMTTSWGLIRYYWVAVKLTIPVAILFVAFGFLHSELEHAAERAERAVAAGATTADFGAAADVALWGFGGSTLSLVVAVLLSVYKPGGKTRRGRRLQPTRVRRRAEIG